MKNNLSEKKFKRSYGDKIFDIVNVLLMVALLIIFIWPLWFVVIASLSDPNQVYLGNVLVLPKGFRLDAYKEMFAYERIWIGYGNTVLYTVVGTLLNLIMTICCAYPLSRKNFKPRKVLQWVFMFTMYFSGGLIPSYLVMKNLGLVNTRAAMVITGAMSVYNMLIVRSYFMNSIPEELNEASILDGANEAQYLIKVALPLSKPVIAVVGLYYALGHWNDFYTALIYINESDYHPLQYVLREILILSENVETFQQMSPEEIMRKLQLQQTLKYSTIIAACLPMLCVYPFIQKYFVKGVMVGAVKG